MSLFFMFLRSCLPAAFDAYLKSSFLFPKSMTVQLLIANFLGNYFSWSSESLFTKKWKVNTFKLGKRFWWGKSHQKKEFKILALKVAFSLFLNIKVCGEWGLESWGTTFYLGLGFQDSFGLVCGFGGFNIYISFSAGDLTNQWGNKAVG